MPRPLLALITILLLLALGAFHSQAAGQDIELDGLVIDNRAGDLGVGFGVNIPDPQPLLAALSEGSVLGLRCRARIERRRGLWPDSKVVEIEYRSLLRMDGLAKEFLIDLPGHETPIAGKDLRALLARGWGSIVLDLGPWSQLRQGRNYTLVLALSVARLDVPTWMRFAVFFWTWDVFPEVEYRLDFRY
jgi:hypothetical protein